jgi:hypothetical protein
VQAVAWAALAIVGCGSGSDSTNGGKPSSQDSGPGSGSSGTDGGALVEEGGPDAEAEGGTSGSSGGAGGDGGNSSSSSGGSDGGSSGSGGRAAGTPVFSPYKDTSISMNWNTNVISTQVSGTSHPFASDLVQHGGSTVTLAFATGECGSETWAGLAGATMATANVSGLVQAGVDYIVSTGGAAGTFTCGSDAGFATFLGRWASSRMIGVDFDIEGGQTASDITALMQRIQAAHATHPGLRFSLTLATLATSTQGATTARSLGTGAQDSLNTLGDSVMAAVTGALGFSGTAATWPTYLTVDLMTMDYGAAATPSVCVVSGSACEMGQSALQAAYNLHDKWGVPYAGIELTPMIGGNDSKSEQFTLADVDTVATFALASGLAGVHFWSYDRDTDCAVGRASPTCNSMGAGYAGAYGYLARFVHDGLH